MYTCLLFKEICNQNIFHSHIELQLMAKFMTKINLINKVYI